MIKLAIVIVHNKGDVGNIAQIETLKPLITQITDVNTQYDVNGKAIGTYNIYHYEVAGLSIPHELKLYQVVPYGVKEPSNFYDIDSHNVLYRKGDEDKTGDHPQFFNWGVKRGTDYGADYVIYLPDVSQFTKIKLQTLLSQVTPNTTSQTASWCKVATVNFVEGGYK
jgi:hypothetical protein